jgi:osmoprotectant transport system substrate-binding protein
MRFSDWRARWFDLGVNLSADVAAKFGPPRVVLGRATRMLTAAVVAVGIAGAGIVSTASAASKPGTGKPSFVLGDKNFPEEFTLGQLYAQALQAQGYTVKLKANIGSTEVAWKALTSGAIQGYPEYDGTLLSAVAGITKNPKSSADAVTRTRNWLAKKGYAFSNVTPFSDSDALVVTKAYAQKHHLTSIGDLKKLGTTPILAGDSPFATRNPDGMPGLKKFYGAAPTFKAVSIGDFYTLLDNGQANIIAGFTTDPQLNSGKYVVLKDPKFIFGFQNVGLVVKQSVVQAEGPAFMQTINKVNKLLTQQAIVALNAAVELDQQSPATVAKKFLQVNHLL